MAEKGVNHLVKHFEFKDSAVAARFVSQAKDSLEAHIHMDIVLQSNVVTMRVPSYFLVERELPVPPNEIAWAAGTADDLAAELQLAGGWR